MVGDSLCQSFQASRRPFLMVIDESTFDTGWCDVNIKRTQRRKSISIKVKEGRVQINIPANMAAIDVQLLLEKKRQWIEQAVQKQHQAIADTTKQLVSGEKFLFQGKQYPLRIEMGKPFHIFVSDDNHLVMQCPERSSQANQFNRLQTWYQTQAELYMVPRTHDYSQCLDQQPSSISIKSYRARWGSCSNQGEITFNWRLIMAPPMIIDYVIVHELCHLIEHNHSSRFWRLVASLDQDYQTHRQWLKDHGDFLQFQLGKF